MMRTPLKMYRRYSRTSLVTLALATTLALAAPLAAVDVTFTRDVAPIFVERCGACHRPSGIAPMSLLSYDSARPWAKSILREVTTRRMPPFHARSSDFALKNDISLEQSQIDTIGAWVRGGVKRGDPAEMPEIPDYDAEARRGPRPELVLELGETFSVPAHADMQRAFTIVNELERDVWIRGVDYEPDLNPVVHHMFVFTDPSGLGRQFQDDDPGVGFLASVDGGDGTDKMMEIFGRGGGGLGGWALGAGVVLYPEGVGQLLPAGTDLVLQYHYWNSTEETLRHRPKIGLFVYDGEPEKVLEFGGPSANDHIDIRPGVGRSEHWADWTAHEDLEIVGVMPHMHFLGKSMRITLHPPNGAAQLLVDVPEYDFEWQTVYQFDEPIVVKAGTRAEMVAAFDNTADNPRNVLDPPRLVTFGERSDDEMADGILFVARNREGKVEDAPRLLSETTEYRAGAAMETVIRFGPNGVPGVTLLADELGKGWTYYRSEHDENTMAGVALEDPQDLKSIAMPYDELVYILEGEVEISDEAGRKVSLGVGEAAVLPQGVEISWRHEEPLRKYWVTWQVDERQVDERRPRPESFVVLDLERDLSDLSLDDTGSRTDTQYEVAETAWVGLWENQPGALSDPISFPYSELMVVLDGVATLVDAEGREGKLKSGDVVLLPAGAPVRWRTDESFRKLYVSFDPLPQASGAH